MENNDLTTALNWRYATKRMNGKKIPNEQLNLILDNIRLAPSSRGLQPFKVLVIEDAETKTKIQQVADNQSQIVECSHLLVFMAWSTITLQQVEDFIKYAAEKRNIAIEKFNKMKSMLINDQLQMTDEEFYQWSSKQIYLALGIAIASAALYKIDSTPMEGFNPARLDKLLGLKQQGLKSTVLLALGYRDAENDWLVNLKKVRREPDELFILKTPKLKLDLLGA